MMRSTLILATLSLLAMVGASTAQDTYQPFSRACVVDGYEVRPGFTAQYVYEGTKYVVGFCCTGCRTKFLQGPAGYMATALAAAKAGPPKKEKKVVLPFVFFSSILFVGGGLFGWRVAFPVTFGYFLQLAGGAKASARGSSKRQWQSTITSAVPMCRRSGRRCLTGRRNSADANSRTVTTRPGTR
jgi:opacity protein-like surface antigen